MSKVHNHDIKQAVILAGGRGTRLMPLTAHCPKPMVKVNEVPFLKLLLDELSQRGIERVVLLTGYLGEQIQQFFGEQHNGLTVTYHQLPDSADTAERVWAAQHLYDDAFILMYSDNYLRFDYPAHLQNWREGDAVQLLVQQKSPGNLVLSDGQVMLYDGTRQHPDAHFVELGFMLVDWPQLQPHCNAPLANFNKVIYSAIEAGKVGATITQAPYFSISDPDRLELLERYLQPHKVILIDRDGTINQKAPRGEYIYRWPDFHFIDDTVEAMQTLAQQGFKFIVITNQAGIGRGIYSRQDVDILHEKMCQALQAQGIDIIDIVMCPHHWEDNCTCRKPLPGMFYQVEKNHQLDMRKLVYIGDDPRDMQAAQNAGTQGVFVGEPEAGSELASLGQFAAVSDAIPVISDFYLGCERAFATSGQRRHSIAD